MTDEGYDPIGTDQPRRSLLSKPNAVKIGISLLFFAILGTLAILVATGTVTTLKGGCGDDSCCGGDNPPGYTPNGKVGFGIGYTTADLTDYQKKVYNVYDNAVWPYAIHQHTTLIPGRFLEGLEVQTSDKYGNFKRGFGCSPTYVEPSLEEYPTSVLVLGVDVHYNDNEPNRAYSALYTKQNPTGLNKTTLDMYEDALEDLIDYLEDLCVDVILVYGNVADFSGNENGGPALTGGNVTYVNYYRNAFKYVSEQINHKKCTNIAMAWVMLGFYTTFNSTGVYNTLDDDHLKLWYPGDDFVDWIGTTAYLVNCTFQVQNITICKITRKDIYQFAQKHCKPVIIEEQGSAGLITNENILSGVNFLSTLIPPFIPIPLTFTNKQLWKWYYDVLFDEIEKYSDVINIAIFANSLSFNTTGIILPGQQRFADNEYIRDKVFDEVTEKEWYCMPYPKDGNDCHSCHKSSHHSSKQPWTPPTNRTIPRTNLTDL